MELTFDWASPEEFSGYIKDVVAPITKMVEAHPEDVQEKAWKAIADDIRSEAESDGRLRLPNKVLLAVGRA